MDYLAYISSPAWRNNPVRLREFEAAGFECRLCSHSLTNGHVLEAHHRTYERLGHEIDGDLTALCRECHLVVTSMMRARRYAIRYFPRPQDCVTTVYRELFDPFAAGDLR